jgi:hypothetical protein
MPEIIPRMDIIESHPLIEDIKPVNGQIIDNALTKPKNGIAENQPKRQKVDESKIQRPLRRESTFEVKI